MNPYAPVHDSISNVFNYKLIESTLREGEQFASAWFDTGSSHIVPPWEIVILVKIHGD